MVSHLESEAATRSLSILPDMKGMRRPSGGTLEIDQATAGDPRGKSKVKFTYVEPSISEPWYERVDIDGAGVPSKDLEATPIALSALLVKKITAVGGVGKGNTTVSLATAPAAVRMMVLTTTNFTPGDLVEIGTGATKEYAKVRKVLSTALLEFDSPLYFTHAPLETVKEVTTLPVSVPGQVSLNVTTGEIAVVDGALANTSLVFEYAQTGFFGSMRLFVVRNPAIVIETDDHHIVIETLPQYELLASPGPGDGPIEVELPASNNGKDYLFGMAGADELGNVGPCVLVDAGAVTTVPDVPQGVKVTNLQVDPPKVTLEWDPATAGHKPGVSNNVYRNPGASVDPVNRALVGATVQNVMSDETGLVAGQDFTYSIARQVPAAEGIVQSRRIQSFGQPAQKGLANFDL